MSTPRSLPLPPRARSHRVVTGRATLAVLDVPPVAGPARPPVVLLPGFTGSKEDFLALLAPISEAGHRVLALDQLGQHESPAAEDPARYAADELGLDVLALLDTIGSERAHLLGHSFGGLVARAAAIAAPQRLASLTLLCSGPAALPAEIGVDLRLLLDALGALTPEQVWTAMRRLDTERGVPAQPADVAEFLRRRFLATDPAQLGSLATQLLTEPDRVEELVAALAGTEVPVLVVTGEDDDRWPVAQQADMARRLRVPHALVPDAGHSPNVENPEATSRLLLDFWSALATNLLTAL